MANLNYKECVTGDCYKGTPIMTPNGDGKNDLFVIACLDNPDNILSIFNRFGELVYSQNNYDNTWAGVSSSGNELPENGYMWVLELNQTGGGVVIQQGTITILREKY